MTRLAVACFVLALGLCVGWSIAVYTVHRRIAKYQAILCESYQHRVGTDQYFHQLCP